MLLTNPFTQVTLNVQRPTRPLRDRDDVPNPRGCNQHTGPDCSGSSRTDRPEEGHVTKPPRGSLFPPPPIGRPITDEEMAAFHGIPKEDLGEFAKWVARRGKGDVAPGMAPIFVPSKEDNERAKFAKPIEGWFAELQRRELAERLDLPNMDEVDELPREEVASLLREMGVDPEDRMSLYKADIFRSKNRLSRSKPGTRRGPGAL